MKLQPQFCAPVLALSLATGTLIAGCQSMPSSPATQSTFAANDHPKALVTQALKSQRRQSFSYHSNMEIAAPTVKNQSFAVASSADTHCQTVHDNAYIALIKQSEAAKVDVYDERFEARREQIRANYETCFKAYQDWRNSLDSDEPKAADPKYAALTKMFDSYPVNQSKSDLKNRQLINAYGLKPLSINAQGNYQPRLGKITMLAGLQYRAKNHQSQINQPIYIDLKSGQLYLWADTAAYINSQLIDDKLGVAWKNKWLKIDLADGSLPKGFGRALIENHFSALDTMNAAMPAEEFSYIAPSELKNLQFTLPSHHLSVMSSASTIVRQQQSAATQSTAYKLYLTTFYDLMTTQFPDLVSDEGLTEAASLTETPFDSKEIAQLMLRSIKDMATSEELSAKPEDIEARFYGFDNRKRLIWQQLHSQEDLSSAGTSDNPLSVDVLSQILPLSRETNFVNLPKDSQVPTAANSIDVKEYSKALLNRYKDGGGTAFGKLVFGAMTGQIDLYPEEATETEIYEESPTTEAELP